MQRITRFAMDRLWQPVGVGTMPAAESDFTSWYLFHDAEGQAAVREVDATMATLPGMEGWAGLSRATSRQIKDAHAREPDLAAAARREALPMATPAPRLILA